MTHDTGHTRDGTASATHTSRPDPSAERTERLSPDSSPADVLAAAADVLFPDSRPERGIYWPLGRRARDRRTRREAHRDAIARRRHTFITEASAVLAGHTGPMAPTHDDHTRPAHNDKTSSPGKELDGDSGGIRELGLDGEPDADHPHDVTPDAVVPVPAWRGTGATSPADVPDRARRTRVITLLVVVVVAVAAAALWLSRSESDTSSADTATDAQKQPSSGAEPTRSVSAAPSTSVAGSDGLSPVPPVPSGGVAPVAPPADDVIDPRDVEVVDPPEGDPTATELSTPDSAVRAWLARWCPFQYTDPFAAAEQRAHAAMTDAGWTTFDPTRSDVTRDSWAQTVTARESGHCAAPTAAISPEAPRTDTSAIVIAAIDRIITAPGQEPYVEQLSEIRIVKRGTDGLWRVDLPTSGG